MITKKLISLSPYLNLKKDSSRLELFHPPHGPSNTCPFYSELQKHRINSLSELLLTSSCTFSFSDTLSHTQARLRQLPQKSAQLDIQFERNRLTRRIQNLSYIQQLVSGDATSFKLAVVLGWGDQCSIKLPKLINLSEFDTFYLRDKTGKVIMLQLDSSGESQLAYLTEHATKLNYTPPVHIDPSHAGISQQFLPSSTEPTTTSFHGRPYTSLSELHTTIQQFNLTPSPRKATKNPIDHLMDAIESEKKHPQSELANYFEILEVLEKEVGLLNRNRYKMSYTKNKGSIAYEMSKVQSG